MLTVYILISFLHYYIL